MPDDAPDVVQAVRELLRQQPDAGARVTCPDCGGILSEYLYGVAKYTCRHCRWQGIIERTGPAAGQRVQTLRPGRRREGRKEG